MKRTGNLIEPIADLDNLRLAFWKAARGKHANSAVIRFRANLERELAAMRAAFLDGSIGFGDYHRFTVHDPKERHICAASFPERVAHHAIMNVCEGILDRAAIHHSYACRKGRGQFAALEQARANARHRTWCLKLDIRKYFDSIDHGILLAQLRRRFKDRSLLALFQRLLASYTTEPGKGLPIGALTSQHLANFHLGPLDRFVLERCGGVAYVRYMDDFVIWSDDRELLRDIRSRVGLFLRTELQLDLKRLAAPGPTSRGLPFLGYRVFGWGLLLAARTKRRFIRRLHAARVAGSSGTRSESEAQSRMTAVCAVAMHARTWRFRQHVLKRFGGVSMGLEPGPSRRELEQPGGELPLREPEQERPVEPEQQPGLPCRAGPQLSSEQPDGS